MKKERELNLDYHTINIQFTDGSVVETKSTWGKLGDTIKLDVDKKTHPAWTGQQKLMDSGGKLSSFNKKFGAISFKK